MEDNKTSEAQVIMDNMTEKANTALENAVDYSDKVVKAATTEINDTITKSVEAANEKLELLQKQIDENKMEYKNNFGIKPPKRSELQEQIAAKADEIANLKKGDTVSLQLKDYVGSAGADSAPYSDYRVEAIKYDPNYDVRIANHLMNGSTGMDGAVRHTFETAETDSTAPKAKGTIATQSSVSLSDIHTPIVTVMNILTLPKEQLNDVKMIESFLSTRLMGNLKDVEDVQLLRGTGATGATPQLKGLSAWARTFADAAARATFVGGVADIFSSTAQANNFDVLTACKAGLAADNFRASKVFMNPTDVAVMVLTKSTQGEYVLRQTVTPDGSIKSFWNGIEIVETAAQAIGTFTMLDNTAAQYWSREGAQVEFGYNDNDFAGNNISVRALLRSALVGYNANGIINETFADFKTALDA